jgi:hypothetical protein
MVLFDPRWVRAPKRGSDVAGRRTRRETGCVLTMRQGEGMQSRERKLKELKHEEGHIALG